MKRSKTDPSGVKPRTDDPLQLYLRDIGKYQKLTVQRERELAVRIKQGDETAVKELVQANLKFVVKVAMRFHGFGLSIADLINEGNIGLLIAARRFDPEKNVRFITYAVWWIRQAIMSALAEMSRIVRLPLKQAIIGVQINRKVNELSAVLERVPTVPEIADSLKISEKEVADIMRAVRGAVSLEPLRTEQDEQHAAPVLLREQETPDEALDKQSLIRSVDELLNILDMREREIIMHHFGIGDHQRLTLQEIGEKFGLTRERIRQIEASAQQKLKRRAKVKKLADYLN